MRTYPPSHVDPRNSESSTLHEAPADYEPPSDEALRSYVIRYWDSFREIAEEYFGSLVDTLPLYRHHPYRSTVVRLGRNGVIIGHKPAAESSVQVITTDDFDPPLQDLNLFTIQQRIDAAVLSFDFMYSSFTTQQAHVAGASAAFKQALSVFWRALEPNDFKALSTDLLEAEGVRLQDGDEVNRLDLAGFVFIDEPAGFVRREKWGFELKHTASDRGSAAALRQMEALIESGDSGIDILCLLTPDDLTSIGRHVAVRSSRTRVWDRAVLNLILHRHREIMKRYFEPYAEAVERSAGGYEKAKAAEFESELSACPSGQTAFLRYENIGTEMLRFLFEGRLGEPHVQIRTQDGVERRDAITRNNRESRFFRRIADRFDADFVIWDFKNYEDPLSGTVVRDVASYTNPGLGRAVVIVCRKGGSPSAHKAQLRQLRNEERMVLIVSDAQLLEMTNRKESGDAPEDVLEDLLDELLLAF